MKIDFKSVLKKFDNFGTGSIAEVKRSSSPNDLILSTVIYRLGMPFKERWQREKIARIAFFLPYLKDSETINSIGKAFADCDDQEVSENKYTPIGKRLMRIVRLSKGNDIIELRRLIRYLGGKESNKRISVNIQNFGEQLNYWGKENKKQIFEDYLISKYTI